ncbi:hypothetical protein Gotur_030592 [Gossypium turneri]
MKKVQTIIIQDASVKSKVIHESLINLCFSKFKYLRALELRNSPLTALPDSIGTLRHLRDLDLARCEGIRELPRSFYKLRSLQSLNLGGTGLKQLPGSVQRLIELRHLEITVEAWHLKEIRAGCWTSLQYLKLNWCIGLECLPEGMQYLKSLRTLVLFRCGSLVSLPRSLKFLTKLEHLEIVRCFRINLKMELEEEEDKDLQHCLELSVLPVWLLNLTSLRELEISSCHYLSALPEGIDRLTNLRKLTIRGCPELSKRYRKNRGEDWHKIAHIRKVVIKD